MASYLVTGGAGFIGSHIVQELVKDDQKVRILDNFSTGKKENLQGFLRDVEILEGDIRDLSTVSKAVKNIDFIFHEAAFVSVAQSMLEPKTCYDINVNGTENLIEEARKSGIQRIVLASSAAVYGEPEAIPLSEEYKTKALSPYAASKVINEIYTDMYSRVFGIEIVALRYFNVFGPRQAPDSQYAAAIPIFIRRLLSNEEITIFGDGNQTRDLIFIKDVVRANILAASTSGVAGNIFNICTGVETSIQELVDSLRGQFPDSLPIKHADPRAGDIVHSVGTSLKAMEMLNFLPQTSLTQGLYQTIEWMRACE